MSQYRFVRPRNSKANTFLVYGPADIDALGAISELDGRWSVWRNGILLGDKKHKKKAAKLLNDAVKAELSQQKQ